MAPPLDWPTLLSALGITTLAALVQGTLGFGFSIVSVPILVLLDPGLAPSPQVLMVVPLTLWMALRERGAIVWNELGWILVGRVPGVTGGAILLAAAPKPVLDVVLALLVGGAAAVLGTGAQVPRTALTRLTAGFFSGLSGVVSSIGGPPVALLYRGAKGSELRGTLAALFLIGVVMTIAGRWTAGALVSRDLVLALWLSPGLVLGLSLSKPLLPWIEGPKLARGVLVLAALASTLLALRAIAAFR
ncbi:MAG: sulfite exporter TauE/SafE family protein [Myxococcota bacterium]